MAEDNDTDIFANSNQSYSDVIGASWNQTSLTKEQIEQLLRENERDYLGPGNFDFVTQTVLTVIFSTLILFGASGNGLVCYVVAKNPLGEFTFASPALSDGQLFIRGEKHLFCIGKRSSNIKESKAVGP